MLRAFFKDSLIYTLPMMLTYGANFFLLPLYTRVLSPADYGALDMLKVFESLVLLVVALEVSQGLARYFIDEKNEANKAAYASSALWFTLFCFSIFLALCLLFTPFLSGLVFGIDGLEDEFRVGVIYIAANGMFHLVGCQLRFELRSADYAKISLASFAVTASTSVTLAYVYDWGIMGMIVGLLSGSVAGLSLGLLRARSSYQVKIDVVKLKEMLVFALPLVPSSAAVFLNGYVDRMMINEFLSLEEVGLYGIGFRIACIVSLILIGFNRALAPLVIKHYREAETPGHIATLMRVFVGVSLFFFLGLTVFSPDILRLLTTPDFYAANQVVVFLVPAILLSQMTMFAPGLALEKKTKMIMWISFAAAIINVLLNWFMIPWFGYVGAAVATMLAQGIVLAIRVRASQIYYRIPFEWGVMTLATMIVSMMAVGGLFIEGFSLATLALKSALLLSVPFVLVWTRLIRLEELRKGYSAISLRLKQT